VCGNLKKSKTPLFSSTVLFAYFSWGQTHIKTPTKKDTAEVDE
tara:strand:+ start:912 stop:1040 length:129 start_codon:yes stop_codon:yes gene_type:complete